MGNVQKWEKLSRSKILERTPVLYFHAFVKSLKYVITSLTCWGTPRTLMTTHEQQLFPRLCHIIGYSTGSILQAISRFNQTGDKNPSPISVQIFQDQPQHQLHWLFLKGKKATSWLLVPNFHPNPQVACYFLLRFVGPSL